MEVAEALGERVELLIVHVVVEQHLVLGALARGRDAGASREGHREPAVEALAVLGAHLERQRAEVARARVAHAEEVAHGDVDGWFGLPVPPRPQHHLAQEVGLVAGDGDPDVADDTGTRDLGEHGFLARLDVEPVVVAARAVP
jgi:hypothetical protein